MLNFFKRKKQTINSITIPNFGWKKEQSSENLKLWINPEKTMAVSLYYFELEPDLPSINNIDKVRTFYRQQVADENGGLIKVELYEWKGFKTVQTIFKFPQEESGMTYLTSITIPFKNCSYVIKIQAPEIGMTGIRDSVIADRLIQEGKISIGENGFENWMSDPYDDTFNKGILMNKSENSIYDDEFENHPLSLSRKMLSQIEEKIEFKPELKKLEKFEK
jgi:hypothetical protein